MFLPTYISKDKVLRMRDEIEKKADRLRSLSAMSGFYTEARARKKRKRLNRHKKNH